jgi:transcription elongation factor Elf1
MHYVFRADSINKMKYCPFCGSEMISVYDGDYNGQVECLNCDECEEELEFLILEEMLDKYPNWIKTFMKEERYNGFS